MSLDSSRRDFLRGRFRRPAAAKPAIRPPVALDEESFVRLCSRCGDCTAACPEKIIVVDASGYPAIDFTKGECTFCAACSAACRTGALNKPDESRLWPYKASIAENCLVNRQIECRSCADYCPVSAIRFQPRPGGVLKLMLDVAKCTGCGGCVAPCPVAAIQILIVDPAGQ